ncbi:tRNA pseudouridine(55) synthase TruB [Planococcus sp. APC 4015]|nr:tRNA pseudouridine(55) synthase TruB [Planococcus sp. APC 4015]
MVRSGVLLVDKPGGMTSHDVVARARKALGTRKIGHAGTLDPMATGLLVLGVEGATRLLTFIVGLDKTYEATIRLGAATDTDDADGEIVMTTDAAAVTDDAIAEHIAPLTGLISQVPSTVSAIKVDGRRAYDLARAGEDVVLKSREVTVSRFDVVATRRGPSAGSGTGVGSGVGDAAVVDLDVVVDCSSGTYIRALARDLGSALGVGGHLTALRRTRIGPFDVNDAVGVDDISEPGLFDPADIATAVLGRLDVTDDEAVDLRHGKRLAGAAARLPASRTAAAVTPNGALVGIVEKRGADVKSAMNMPYQARA